MKITVNSTALAKALRAAGRAVPNKTTLPVLECFRLEAGATRLVVTASNLDITVKVPVTLLGIAEDGVCAIPAKKFTEHVCLLPDCEVTLETKEGTMCISWAKGRNIMQMMDASDYPDIQEPDGSMMMNMPAQQLLQALNITIPACAKDEMRPQLCGVHFDILDDRTRLVASDSKTLTYDTVESTTGRPDNFTVPTTAASLLKSSIRRESAIVRLTHDEKSVCFNLGDIIIQTRKVVGKYPNYMSVIPKNSNGVAVTDKQGLIGSLRRLAACSDRLKMTMTPLSILFTATNTETGSAAEEDCACNYDGREMAIGINPHSFLDILENVASDEIHLAVSDPKRAIVATTSEHGADMSVSLFMPVMLA